MVLERILLIGLISRDALNVCGIHNCTNVMAFDIIPRNQWCELCWDIDVLSLVYCMRKEVSIEVF